METFIAILSDNAVSIFIICIVISMTLYRRSEKNTRRDLKHQALLDEVNNHDRDDERIQ